MSSPTSLLNLTIQQSYQGSSESSLLEHSIIINVYTEAREKKGEEKASSISHHIFSQEPSTVSIPIVPMSPATDSAVREQEATPFSSRSIDIHDYQSIPGEEVRADEQARNLKAVAAAAGVLFALSIAVLRAINRSSERFF